MFLRDQILELITADPNGMSFRMLCRRLPDTRPKQIQKACSLLRNSDIVLRDMRYQLPPTAAPATEPNVHTGSGFISPPTIERLMAGR